MNQSAAQRILQGLQHSYQDQTDYRMAAEVEFPHLKMRDYRRIQAELEALHFRHLVDYENMRVSSRPNALIKRTLIRCYLSIDGDIAAAHYQIRPRLRRRLILLLKGFWNLRWIAAPRDFMRALKTRNVVDFETELSDGTFIATSNAQAAAKITLPSSIDSEHYPYGHPASLLLERHRQRLAARLAASPGVEPRAVTSVNDVLAKEARMHSLKAKHRQEVGWITNSELQQMSGNNPALADQVYKEVQKLLRGGQG
jgi:hypothetical protein